MHVYHKYYSGQDLVRAFVMSTGKKGDPCKQFLGDGSQPTDRITGACKCGGTVAAVGGGTCLYHVCLKCGREVA